MKKKVFFALKPFWQFLLLLVLLMSVGSVVLFVYIIINFKSEIELYGEETIKELIVFPIGAVYMGWEYYKLQRNRIIFDKDFIYVPEEKKKAQNRIQYEVKVKYKDIKEVKLITSNKNSKDKTYDFEFSYFPSCFYFLPYMEITLKNGIKERVLLLNQTKRQKVKIINELKLRLKMHDNIIDLPEAKEMVAGLGKIGWNFPSKKSKKDF